MKDRPPYRDVLAPTPPRTFMGQDNTTQQRLSNFDGRLAARQNETFDEKLHLVRQGNMSISPQPDGQGFVATIPGVGRFELSRGQQPNQIMLGAKFDNWRPSDFPQLNSPGRSIQQDDLIGRYDSNYRRIQDGNWQTEFRAGAQGKSATSIQSIARDGQAVAENVRWPNPDRVARIISQQVYIRMMDNPDIRAFVGAEPPAPSVAPRSIPGPPAPNGGRRMG